MNPAIITVAITGSQPQKSNNPSVPISISEQIESTQEAFEAGASLVHIHVRDDEGKATSDPKRFAKVQEGIRTYCPGMIIQFSTGGRGRKAEERGSCIALKPDMASLATGSVNFRTIIYENAPDLIDGLAQEMNRHQVKPEIELFDLAMLYNAAELVQRGLLKAPLHVQFVMGIPNALPARENVLDFMIRELETLVPGSSWTGAGVGKYQRLLNEWSAAKGGHLRTGLEDNVRYDAGRLAASNAELVKLAAEIAAQHGRAIANPQQARQMLGL